MLRTLCIFLFNLALISSYAQTQPNVVLIFLDDMGYGDLSVTGALQYKTPAIDQLAAEGIRFTNFLAVQAVCSASRAGLLTGMYPNRIGITGALFPNSKIGIHPNEVTLAELMKQNGYATGMVGKWHLGDSREFLPLQNGFDEYFGLPYSNDMWPVDYEGRPATDWRKDSFPPLFLLEGNEKRIPVNTLADQAELTRLYTERAIDFIKRKKANPFFLYLAHSMPHVPIQASARFKGKSQQGLYGDVMMEVDWSVGEILKTLKENNLDKNTIVIFTSDNGPWLNYGNHAGSSGGFREGKGTSFEGGTRVPCLIRWPEKIKGGQISNSLAATIDLFPTIADLLSINLTSTPDGISLKSILLENSDARPRKEFYYYYRRNALEAVRLDDWKLVLPHPGRTYENFEVGLNGYPGQVNENASITQALYDLRRDPGERYNVQAQFPEIVKQLMELANRARADLGDDLVNEPGKNRRDPGRTQ